MSSGVKESVSAGASGVSAGASGVSAGVSGVSAGVSVTFGVTVVAWLGVLLGVRGTDELADAGA